MKTIRIVQPFAVAAAVALLMLCGLAHAQSTFNKYQPANGVQCNTGSTYVDTACTASQIPAPGSDTQVPYNHTGTPTGNAQFTVGSDLGLIVGGATGGSKGPGTLNATALYINGSAVGTSSGAVSSVALAEGSTTPIYTITGSPVTSAGTLTETLRTQSANTLFAGPTTGAAAQPAFRALVGADISGLSANPTASVGLTVVNGSASTYMRSDASPALSQSISPTMTGNWVYTPSSGVAIVANTSGANTSGLTLNNSTAGGVELNLCGTSNTSGARCWVERVGSTGTFTVQTADDTGATEQTALQLSRDTSGNFLGAIIPAPTTGVAATLLLNGSTTGGVLTVNGGNATNSYIRLNTAGTNYGFIGDAFSVFATTTGDMGIGGGGKAIHIGAGAESLNLGTGGNMTLAAPSSGTAASLNGLDGTDTVIIASTGAAAGLGIGWDVHFSPTSWNITASSTDSLALGTLGSGGVAFIAGNSSRMTIPTGGGVTISTPSGTAVALTANGVANNWTSIIQGSTTTSQSLGLLVKGGTNSSDNAMNIQNAAGSTTFAQFLGDGGIIFGAPSGGNKGAGTLNAQALYVNGVAVGGISTYGSFSTNGSTCSLTDNNNASGCTRTGTGTYTITFTTAVHECVFNTTQNSGTATIQTAYMPGSVGTSGTLNTFSSTGSTNTAADLTSGGIHFVCE